MENRWISPKIFEIKYGMSQSTQSKYRTNKNKNKRMPFAKIGGFIFYDYVKIDQWIEENSVGCYNGV